MTAPLRSHKFQAMGCPCALHAYGERVQIEVFIERALAEVRRFDAKFSSYRDDSVISQLNRNAGRPTTVDDETAALLDYAAVCFEQSGGLFDITMGAYRRVWYEGMHALPTATELDRCRQRVGWQRVSWCDKTLRMHEGMALDLGGVVKEYAADALVSLATECGVRSGLIDLGGDLRVIGPHPDGRPWSIGIANPDVPATPIATTYVHTGAITTSGTYERYLTIDGKRYSHLIDPRSGWPVDGLRSVTVIADQAVVAGSLSTIASLMHRDAGLQWLHAQDVPFFAIDGCGRHHSHAQAFVRTRGFAP